MEESLVQVAVAGGSVAGATAARVLAERGISTLIIDKAGFPRNKACGEGLSFLGVRSLERSGLGEKVLRLPHLMFHGIRFILNDSELVIPFPMPGLCIRRAMLDVMLLEEAVKSGARLITGAAIERIDTGGKFRIQAGGKTVTSDYLIVADGAHSPCATLLKVGRKGRGGRYGITVAMEGTFSSPQRYVSILLERECEVFLTPTSERSLNVSILGPKEVIKKLMKKEKAEELAGKGCRAAGFTGEKTSLLGSGPLGFFKREWRIENVLAAGDAQETFDPRGGMGMSHAVITGELAGRALAAVTRGEAGFDEARSWYIKRQKETAFRLRAATRLVCFATSPGIRRLFMLAVGGFRLGERAGRMMAELEGKEQAAPEYH